MSDLDKLTPVTPMITDLEAPDLPSDFYLPAPEGRECTGIVFYTGVPLEVMEDIETVADILTGPVEGFYHFHDCVFGREVKMPAAALANVAFLDVRWKDLDAVAAQVAQQRLARLQAKRAAAASPSLPQQSRRR